MLNIMEEETKLNFCFCEKHFDGNDLDAYDEKIVSTFKEFCLKLACPP